MTPREAPLHAIQSATYLGYAASLPSWPARYADRRPRTNVRLRPLAAAVVLAALVSMLVGCSVESLEQRRAREAAQEHVRGLPRAGEYDPGDTHCTDSATLGWFVEQETAVFVCAVRKRGDGCDWFRVSLGNVGVTVALEARNAGCVLPV